MHCSEALFGSTVWKHCLKALFGCTVWKHYLEALFESTVRSIPKILLYRVTSLPYGIVIIRSRIYKSMEVWRSGGII